MHSAAAVDFFLSLILICYGYLQIFELCHTFKVFITCVYFHGINIFQLSEHLLPDQSPYNGLMKLYGVYGVTP